MIRRNSQPNNRQLPATVRCAAAVLVAVFSGCAGGGNILAAEAQRPADRFEYYGWFYASYGHDGTPGDLPTLAEYTNTAIATTPGQVRMLAEHGFKHIIFSLSVEHVLREVWKRAGRPMPAPDAYGVIWHKRHIAEYRQWFFEAWRAYLQHVRAELVSVEAYAHADIFFIADEPALHRNVFLDQPFLDQHVAEFEHIFPEKKCLIAFAANDGEPFPGTGPHFEPPPGVDLVCVQPFFTSRSPERPQVPCDRAAVRRWLYEESPASTVAWAKKFDKPIIVVGDARIQGGRPPEECWVVHTYEILRDDPSVHGIIWFVYDRHYTEQGNHGLIRGAASDPRLVELIASLGTRASKPAQAQTDGLPSE